ncbi:hypothetical protein [Actinacidiphila yeochonensis]|uniref:hypothetical protein n=1 Tax=Actinacidiphila yeochonensis TaxID=89050 RepID=UPI0005640C18|nr:hypothetical protein [Actinacidiphila yeochonensis]
MTVTEIRPQGETETYAEGLARASVVEAEAEAARIKNREAAARQELSAQKAAARAQREIEAELAAAEDDREQRATARREQAAGRARAERSATTWKRAALGIAVVCVVVSLPLQVMAFYSKKAPFLAVAPLVIEGIAWALLAGAQAAIDDDRPAWLYRLLAGGGASFAASVNYLHGSAAYGMATGLGGAFCSIAGPMIWDLHEHGRIAKREGRKPWRARRAEARTARAEARRVKRVNAARADRDQSVWERAEYLAAALGEVVPSEKTYRRAWDEIHGAEVGSTAVTIAGRRTARRAVRVAQNGPLDDPVKGESSQVESQMDPSGEGAPKAPRTPGEDGRKRNGGTPPTRRRGDVQYSPGARRQMSLSALRAKAAPADAESVSQS